MPNLEGQVFTAAALAVTRMGLKLAPVKEQDMHMAAAAGAAGRRCIRRGRWWGRVRRLDRGWMGAMAVS